MSLKYITHLLVTLLSLLLFSFGVNNFRCLDMIKVIIDSLDSSKNIMQKSFITLKLTMFQLFCM